LGNVLVCKELLGNSEKIRRECYKQVAYSVSFLTSRGKSLRLQVTANLDWRMRKFDLVRWADDEK
jgi:hypothetical protein